MAAENVHGTIPFCGGGGVDVCATCRKPLCALSASDMAESLPDFTARACPSAVPGPLAPLAQRAAVGLIAASQTVCACEATTAGLIQAALQSVAGASAYTTCAAIAYSPKKAGALLGGALLPDPALSAPADGAQYIASKKEWTAQAARRMRMETGATWCVSESGACGPTFRVPDMTTGFTVVFISGPVERGVVYESSHADRESNMFSFARAALDLLAECVEEASNAAPSQAIVTPAVISATADLYGGIVAKVEASAARGCGPAAFSRALGSAITSWAAESKRGLWLTIPAEGAHLIGVALREHQFQLHHAKPEYALVRRRPTSITRYMPQRPQCPKHRIRCVLPMPTDLAWCALGRSAGDALAPNRRAQPAAQVCVHPDRGGRCGVQRKW